MGKPCWVRVGIFRCNRISDQVSNEGLITGSCSRFHLDDNLILQYYAVSMLMDLHTHSVSSDDSKATVEQYAKWVNVLRRKGYAMDGFVLTEHRKFDFHMNYEEIAKESDVTILKGSELDTNYGHFLVYGVTYELTRLIDFSNVDIDAIELMRVSSECGAIAIPAHPGRFGIGLIEYIENGADFSGVKTVEHFNGSNRPGEQERAESLIKKYAYRSIGGSDSHIVSSVGICMTEFDTPVYSETDLVRELKIGKFRPVRLSDSQ